uniref:RNase NYN domain-containing protein n=2 Tax=Pectinophora gossypiella TaxID=13191 RepID=A0A1E1W0R4_PECGO
MGKPSSSRACKKPESTSTTSNRTKMNVSMTNLKAGKKLKKTRHKTNANIKKLFDHLRRESHSSISSLDNTNDTVIALDTTTLDTTPPHLPHIAGIFAKKRKLNDEDSDPECKRKKEAVNENNNTLIVIDDSTLVENNNEPGTPKKPSQVHCSTPKHVQNKEPSFTPVKSKNIKRCNSLLTTDITTEITDLTKEINRDSYLTIDLTTESLNCSSIDKSQTTVIDLENSVDNADCTVVSVSNTNLSMSGDSDVTVLNMPKNKNKRQIRRFVNGIAKLDPTEKGKLLELITQNIFNGCSVSDKGKGSLQSLKKTTTCATETVEDTYIKEVILGQTHSRNSIGSNIYNPEHDVKNKTGLRMVVIDGSNVAMEHNRGRNFSVKGLKICIDYFLQRGHVVKAFVPRFRCKYGKSTDPRLLDELERRGLVVYTPSREIQGRMVTSYDDRYIVQCAAEFDGVIVSGDNYRDLLLENPRWRFVIENRLLPFTWVNDMIMFPRDPLGRQGPSLEQFLRHPAPAQSDRPNVTNCQTYQLQTKRGV